MKKFSIAAAAFVAIAMASGTAGAADAKKGKKVFKTKTGGRLTTLFSLRKIVHNSYNV